ncbi:MAG: polysaccharide export protein [Acidobacteriota bacterium]|nr:polysaccharide export protein [Acidobacteriota bacterium]
MKKTTMRYWVLSSACLLLFTNTVAAMQDVGPISSAEGLRTGFVIGLEDQIVVQALHVPEISDKAMRIGPDGYIQLPLIGRVHAAGMSVHALESEIKTRLRDYIQEPEVAVTVFELKSQPVSVLGAVKSPGVRQLEGSQSILDMLSAAGGLDADAGYTLTLLRRREWGPVPLPGARSDASGQFSVGDISLSDLMEGKAAEQNIVVRPHDVISVPRAKLIYVIGEVHKSGGFTVREQETVSVLQVLSLAEGLLRTAGPEHAKIIRRLGTGAEKQEIPLNVKNILAGKEADVVLKPNDILFIPNSASRSIALRSLEAAIQIGTGVVIWHR